MADIYISSEQSSRVHREGATVWKTISMTFWVK